MILWIVSSLIATPIVAIFIGPQIPPGNDSVQSSGQVFDTTVLLSVLTPVLLFVVLFVGFSISHFRSSPGLTGDGPPDRGDSRLQIVWAVVTAVVAMSLATFGSYELVKDGAGSGQGPSPAFLPAGAATAMNVQVIGQQWAFTYRYPSYGGIETPHLELPANTLIRLHVTSLDVVHSFWAYGLGVKADANPGVDNVVYVKVKGPRSFQLRCAELCGLWHGYMFDTGQIVTPAAFKTWIAQQAKALRTDPEVPAALRALLPPRSRGPRRMKLRRLIGFHLGTALVFGVVCWYLGWYLGHQISYPSVDYFDDIDQNDIAIFLGYVFGTVGFLAGHRFPQLSAPRDLRAGRRRCRRPAAHGATSGWRPITRSSGSSTCGASGSSSSSGA